jgi:nucleotide-binding universal stress UspA family protein
MNGVRKVLVPIDFSEDSAEALKYAVSLAQKTEAELIVLHVTQRKEAHSFLDSLAVMEGLPVQTCPNGIPVDQLLREKALDLYRFIEGVVRNPGPLKITRKVVLGDKANKILEIVKEENIDLVVLPIPRRSFFSYLMARGKLLKLISRCPCPVVVKPLSGEPRPPTIGRSAFAR